MKIRVQLTGGAIKNNYIKLCGHLDKFDDVHIGGSNIAECGKPLKLHLGLGSFVMTDICRDKQMFRTRAALRQFLSNNDLVAGDILIVEQVSASEWRLSA